LETHRHPLEAYPFILFSNGTDNTIPRNASQTAMAAERRIDIRSGVAFTLHELNAFPLSVEDFPSFEESPIVNEMHVILNPGQETTAQSIQYGQVTSSPTITSELHVNLSSGKTPMIVRGFAYDTMLSKPQNIS
jgi:hypothetical protein